MEGPMLKAEEQMELVVLRKHGERHQGSVVIDGQVAEHGARSDFTSDTRMAALQRKSRASVSYRGVTKGWTRGPGAVASP